MVSPGTLSGWDAVRILACRFLRSIVGVQTLRQLQWRPESRGASVPVGGKGLYAQPDRQRTRRYAPTGRWRRAIRSSSFELILSLLASLLFEQVNYPICMRVCSRWTVFQTHTPKGGRKMFFQFEFVFACVAREVRKEG